jgi:hypothetical protein
MSDVSDRDINILHEADTREVIQDEIETTVGLTNPAINNALEAHAINATFDNDEVAQALDDLGIAINLILEVLRTNGLIAVDGV